MKRSSTSLLFIGNGSEFKDILSYPANRQRLVCGSKWFEEIGQRVSEPLPMKGLLHPTLESKYSGEDEGVYSLHLAMLLLENSSRGTQRGFQDCSWQYPAEMPQTAYLPIHRGTVCRLYVVSKGPASGPLTIWTRNSFMDADNSQKAHWVGTPCCSVAHSATGCLCKALNLQGALYIVYGA